MLGAIQNKSFISRKKNDLSIMFFLPLSVPFGPLIEESYSV